MQRDHVETYYDANKWHNRIAGVDEPFSDHYTSGDARLTGRQEASRLKVDHVVRNVRGQVLAYTRYRDGGVLDSGEADATVAPRIPVTTAPRQEAIALVTPELASPIPVPLVKVPDSGGRRPQLQLDPAARYVLHEVNVEMKGQATGAILWALVHRMPASLGEAGPSMRQLAGFAVAIHEGTFRG